MLVVLPIAERELAAAMKLVAWMKHLGGLQRHSALVVLGNPITDDMARDLLREAGSLFGQIKCIRQSSPDEVREWPYGNALFRLAAEYVTKREHVPFLWVESDAIPLVPDWLDRIEAEYQRVGKPFMGALYSRPVPHINGVMVYSARLSALNPWMMIAKQRPWDLTRAEVTLRNAHQTNLIVRSLADPATNTPHTFPEMNALDAIIPNGCVLFHGCKDGTLLDRLFERDGVTGSLARFERPIVVRRSGALGDALAATCVASKLREAGYNVIFQTSPGVFPLLQCCPDITLTSDNRPCDVNLDGTYEKHPERRSKSFPEIFIEATNMQLGLRLQPLNTAPVLEHPEHGKKRFRRRYADLPLPWIGICPRSNSFAVRTVPDATWAEVSDQIIIGTRFWLGTHGPAPDGIVDLRIKHIKETVIACSSMDLVISVDTGPLHIAAALGTPALAIEQSSSPELHLSDQRDYEVIRPANLTCLNCQEAKCRINESHPPCQDISARAIASAAIAKLRSKYSEDVSCVIPVYRPSKERLNKCLEAVLPQVDEVVICRGQAGIFPEGAIQHPKIRYLAGRHGDVGYGRNMNYGSRHTNGKWILALTDDVFLDPGAVAELLKTANQDPKIAAVGHLLWYPGRDKIQHGGTRRNAGDIGWGHIDHNAETPSITEACEVENVTGASVLYRREAFYSVLGFDERYRLYYEDNDLCLRLRKAGWKIWYTPKAQAVHDEHASTKITPNIAREVERSRGIFTKLWKPYFERNAPNTLGTFK